MPEWNPKAIDYNEGVDLMPDGTTRGRKIGAWVMTQEEAIKAGEERRKKRDKGEDVRTEM